MSDTLHPKNDFESNRPDTDAGLDDTFAAPHRPRWIASAVLLSAVTLSGAALAAWKIDTLRDADAAAASQPEWPEVVTVATSEPYEHRPTVTAIGTVLATRSVTLRNEVSGTVEQVRLEPGAIVEAGAVLVQLDVSVERAELAAHRAQAALAESQLERYQQASEVRTDVESIVRSPLSGSAHPGANQNSPAAGVVPRAPFAWNLFLSGLVLLGAAFLLIAFGAYRLQSAWFLLSLAIPWFLLGCFGAVQEFKPFEREVSVLIVFAVLASLALVGYGIWMTGSAWPLLIVLVAFVVRTALP